MLDQEEFPLDFEFQESFVNQTNLCKELTLVGFISFRSSPKPLVSEALQRCQEIGKKVCISIQYLLLSAVAEFSILIWNLSQELK